MRKSKLLVSTNGNADQTYTNTLRANGTALTSGATYRISAPAGYRGPITVGADGTVRFGKTAYDKVTADGPQTVTIEAVYQGKTAGYTFTLTDHFSPRDLHTSAVLGGDIYVIGGVTQKFVGGTSTVSGQPEISSNEVWRSSDGGLTWDQVAGSTRFTDRANHGSVVLDGALYVIAGRETDKTTGRDDVWRSADRGVSWSRVTPTGASVSFPMDYGIASAVLGTTMYVLGGITFGPVTRYNEVWQSTDRGVNWTQATNATDPKFPARSAAAAVVLGSAGAKLYVIGGNTTSGAGTGGLDDVWESSDGASWTHVNASAASGDKFPARKEHSVVAVGDTVYVIAGDQGGGARRDVWTSGDKGATWTQAAANAEFPARRNHASAARGGALYVIGGGEGSTQLFNDVWKSTDGGATWVNVHKNP